MTDKPGPDALRSLAVSLGMSARPAERDALAALADAWQAERSERAELEERLAQAHNRVEVLEKDRQWWKDNAIKRHRRAEERRSGRQGG